MARTRASARALTEHDEIRDWAEARNAKPACVSGTGGGEDVGMIRLEFPGYRSDESLQQISWDDWFEKFDERKLALLVQDETARGQKSNFNKLVTRDTVEESNGGRNSSRRNRRTGSDQEKSSAEDQEFASDADVDGELDLNEEVEVQSRPSASRTRNRSAQGRRRQQKPASRDRAANSRKSSTTRGRSGRSRKRASVRGASSQRSRTRGRSSASQKKPAARVRSGPRSSPGRTGGGRRAA